MTKEKTLQYQKAYVELNEILKSLSEEENSKNPKMFKDNLVKNMDKSYKFELDSSKGIFEQKLMVETEALLVEIYERYLASAKEKEVWEKYDKICLNRIEQNKKEKYNPSNMFINRTIEQCQDLNQNITDETAMVAYKESIFTKIKNWFKAIFSKKKN